MARPEYAERIQRRTQEAYRTGVDGWVDDDLVFVKDWGFDLSTLSVPDDGLVRRRRHPGARGARPVAGGRNVPGALVVTMSGGHMELVNRAEELRRLAHRRRRPPTRCDAA